MKIVKMHDAKSQLSALIRAAEEGEEIIISRGNEPVARLTAIHRNARIPGLLKGKLAIPDGVFDPLPDDEIAAWDN
ncbi:type II toxin-antitoxin system Phd/YefM family antitoxin [Thalassospira alkalitolerans]|uniref:type II toxin-antitoxin system Phd/YefM family antitoxin n=1 Tax=Thalassospira alkalitolerans TaxID=1293890 RepID=UPI003AA8DD78